LHINQTVNGGRYDIAAYLIGSKQPARNKNKAASQE
jgi:hypothetical protein